MSGSGVGEFSFGVWEGGGILSLEGEYFFSGGGKYFSGGGKLLLGRENSTASPPLYETLHVHT